MVDDAQASIASLKTQLNAAQAEAAETAAVLQHAEADLSEHEADSQRQQQSLRYRRSTIYPHYAKFSLPKQWCRRFQLPCCVAECQATIPKLCSKALQIMLAELMAVSPSLFCSALPCS